MLHGHNIFKPHYVHVITSKLSAAGPVQGTVGDFWRMVWDYKLPTIIMLTETVEAGKVSTRHTVDRSFDGVNDYFSPEKYV